MDAKRLFAAVLLLALGVVAWPRDVRAQETCEEFATRLKNHGVIDANGKEHPGFAGWTTPNFTARPHAGKQSYKESDPYHPGCSELVLDIEVSANPKSNVIQWKPSGACNQCGCESDVADWLAAIDQREKNKRVEFHDIEWRNQVPGKAFRVCNGRPNDRQQLLWKKARRFAEDLQRRLNSQSRNVRYNVALGSDSPPCTGACGGCKGGVLPATCRCGTCDRGVCQPTNGCAEPDCCGGTCCGPGVSCCTVKGSPGCYPGGCPPDSTFPNPLPLPKPPAGPGLPGLPRPD